jgi:hypothetical protein
MAEGFRTRISLVAESTYGTTPATPTMRILPITGHGITDRVTQTPSNVINTTRNIDDMVRTGRGATGTIPCELRHSPSGEALDLAMQAIMSATATAAASTGTCTIPGGTKTITKAAFAFATDFAVGDIVRVTGSSVAAENGLYRVTASVTGTLTVDRAANFTAGGSAVTVSRAARTTNALLSPSFTVEVAHLDLQRAHIFRGVVFNSATINLAVNQLATVTFQIEARDSIVTGNTGTTDVFIAGATYSAMTARPTLDPIGVQEIILGNGTTDTDVPAQSVTLTLSNNITPREQLASLGPVSMSRGQYGAAVQASAYFDNQEDHTTFLANNATNFWVFAADASNRGWSFAIPTCKITDHGIPVTGPGSDIFRALSVAGYLDATQNITCRMQRWD